MLRLNLWAVEALRLVYLFEVQRASESLSEGLGYPEVPAPPCKGASAGLVDENGAILG